MSQEDLGRRYQYLKSHFRIYFGEALDPVQLLVTLGIMLAAWFRLIHIQCSLEMDVHVRLESFLLPRLLAHGTSVLRQGRTR
jgi:hypothetical protein